MRTYDAIVVGSGITGGWAAKELCERGPQAILVLEAGRANRARRRLRGARAGVGDALPRLGRPHARWSATSRCSGSCYACDEWSQQVLRERPRESVHHRRRTPASTGSGAGRSAGARSLGPPGLSLERSRLRGQRAGTASAVDWPIRYRDIAPWYTHVERFIGVSGQRRRTAQLPDGEFLPPMEMNCAERDVAGAMQRPGAGSG